MSAFLSLLNLLFFVWVASLVIFAFSVSMQFDPLISVERIELTVKYNQRYPKIKINVQMPWTLLCIQHENHEFCSIVSLLWSLIMLLHLDPNQEVETGMRCHLIVFVQIVFLNSSTLASVRLRWSTELNMTLTARPLHVSTGQSNY